MASIQDERGYNQGFKPSPAMIVRTRRRVDFITGQFATGSTGDILEIGCGTGEFAAEIATRIQGEVTGIDISPKFIELARKQFVAPNLRFEVADFKNPSFSQTFDYIIGNGILHHLYYNLDSSLSCIHGLLRPGGKIVFLEPNLLNPYCWLIFKTAPLRKWARLEPDEMAFSRRFIASRLRRLGFTDVLVKYRDFLLPNTPRSLVGLVIALGEVAEKMPMFKNLSQSLFISATRGK